MYTTKDGAVISDEWMDAVSSAAENGELPGEPLFTEINAERDPHGPSVVTLYLDRPQAEALDAAAQAQGMTRTQIMREAFDHALLQEIKRRA